MLGLGGICVVLDVCDVRLYFNAWSVVCLVMLCCAVLCCAVQNFAEL
jgi:hypothetical protein